ncbi:uncharacterized protein BJ171DRAFT_488566 [Polychytrium aggregatum]|uniref:uncharacterized protein n=1 Tax=Polychytrium aggregatum TaxID=110093 RepID=UPI0022FF0811|nr:uncharacterized protein BJ171DRAFT_488566 [Polychytrium aggregatum]KAI9209115.1 hypothetical protein BJ171DRAFT_488566 [Polychytrium aggregatum]
MPKSRRAVIQPEPIAKGYSLMRGRRLDTYSSCFNSDIEYRPECFPPPVLTNVSEISFGRYTPPGTSSPVDVVIKRPLYPGCQAIADPECVVEDCRQRFVNGYYVWVKLSNQKTRDSPSYHERILPMMAQLIQRNCDDSELKIVTRLYYNGSMINYFVRHWKGIAATKTEHEQLRMTTRMMLDVALGIRHMHTRGIIHANISAEHVIVTDDHRCLLTGFGSSFEERRNAARKRYPPSTPPLSFDLGESIAQQWATKATDVWDFGMLCTVISNHTGDLYFVIPVVAYDTLAKIFDGFTNPSIPPDMKPKFNFNPRMPKPLVDLLRGCLDFEASNRPKIKDVVEQLESILEKIENGELTLLPIDDGTPTEGGVDSLNLNTVDPQATEHPPQHKMMSHSPPITDKAPNRCIMPPRQEDTSCIMKGNSMASGFDEPPDPDEQPMDIDTDSSDDTIDYALAPCTQKTHSRATHADNGSMITKVPRTTQAARIEPNVAETKSVDPPPAHASTRSGIQVDSTAPDGNRPEYVDTPINVVGEIGEGTLPEIGKEAVSTDIDRADDAEKVPTAQQIAVATLTLSGELIPSSDPAAASREEAETSEYIPTPKEVKDLYDNDPDTLLRNVTAFLNRRPKLDHSLWSRLTNKVLGRYQVIERDCKVSGTTGANTTGDVKCFIALFWMKMIGNSFECSEKSPFNMLKRWSGSVSCVQRLTTQNTHLKMLVIVSRLIYRWCMYALPSTPPSLWNEVEVEGAEVKANISAVSPDILKLLFDWARLASSYHWFGKFFAAICCMQGTGTAMNNEMAVALLNDLFQSNESSDMRRTAAATQLALYHYNTAIQTPNKAGHSDMFRTAIQFLEFSSSRDDILATFVLGKCYYLGQGVPFDRDRATALLSRDKMLQYPPAKALLDSFGEVKSYRYVYNHRTQLSYFELCQQPYADPSSHLYHGGFHDAPPPYYHGGL